MALGEKLVVVLTVALVWLLLGSTMRKMRRNDPWAWVIVVSCLVAIGYAGYMSLPVVK